MSDHAEKLREARERLSVSETALQFAAIWDEELMPAVEALLVEAISESRRQALEHTVMLGHGVERHIESPQALAARLLGRSEAE